MTTRISLVALLSFVVLAGSSATGAGATISVEEFAIYPGSSPFGIAAGPDGGVWFAEDFRNGIGRITPSGTLREVRLPTPEAHPIGITSGPDGNLWFTEFGAGKIGRLTVGGDLTEFATPTADSQPRDIVAGPDGNLWFTEDSGNRIGQITTDGAITEYPVITGNSSPNGITVGATGTFGSLSQAGTTLEGSPWLAKSRSSRYRPRRAFRGASRLAPMVPSGSRSETATGSGGSLRREP